MYIGSEDLAKYLVIIESPGKIKKIKSYLGGDYEVIATCGHIRDLPLKKIGVNIKKDFEASFESDPSKKDLINNMIKKSQKMEMVYLLMDGDREGEGIAAHVAALLPKGIKYLRAKSIAITKKDIVHAIQDAGSIDLSLVDAYLTRRILDRLVGFRCSYVTKQATGGISAGRVQSAALRILAEREKEIRDFVPEEYWPIEAELLTIRDEKIMAKIKKPDQMEIKDGETAKEICTNLKKGPVKVSKYEVKDVDIKAYAPFTTSTLYQSAASILGWNSKKTAQIAQNLYENSLITYHRTDSTFIGTEFINDMRSFINSDYGEDYLPSKANVYTSAKMAQEAHEAIRITDVHNSNGGSGDQGKLYRLVRKRTISSQMSPMQQRRSSAEFSCKDYVLSATGSRVLFDGWRHVWNYGELSDTELPELILGETVKVIDLMTEQKFTTPPDHYNDRSIIRELERRGIGRPSTYATIIETLKVRSYTENSKRRIVVTDVGIRVSDFLVHSNYCFVDLEFTRNLETQLDQIAGKDTNKLAVLTDFWNRLKTDIENSKRVKDEYNKTDLDCPQCGKGKLVRKHSQYGPFYSCERYKDGCKYIAEIAEDGSPQPKKKAKASEYTCPQCESPMVERESKYGKFHGCTKYSTGCRGMRDSEGNVIKKSKKKKWKKKSNK